MAVLSIDLLFAVVKRCNSLVASMFVLDCSSLGGKPHEICEVFPGTEARPSSKFEALVVL